MTSDERHSSDVVVSGPIEGDELAAAVLGLSIVDDRRTIGVRFDPDELASVLQHATGVDERPTGVAAWIQRVLES